MSLFLQLLQKNLHDRKSFDCGLPPVNDFLREQARRQMEQRINRTWVLVTEASDQLPARVLGYFTLTQSTVLRAKLPAAGSMAKFPMYPLPVIKLAWLGVALEKQHSKQRIGETLLLDALHSARFIAEQTGLGVAVVTDPLTAASEAFFRKYGFQPMAREFRERSTLFIPMQTLKAL